MTQSNRLPCGAATNNDEYIDKHGTILIVDDEYVNRKMMAMAFKAQYAILEAGDGVCALELLRNEMVDIVILDLMMPELDGYGVLSAMHEDEKLRHIPVVVVTSSSEDESMIRALDGGAQDVILKPYNPDVIRHRIDNILTRMTAARQAEEYRVYERLLRKAEIDEKTGIYTRQAFCRKTSELLLANPNTKYVICRWDIDRFKAYNDTFGVAAGDEFLAKIGEAYRENYTGTILVPGHLDADHFVSCFERDAFIRDSIIDKLDSFVAGLNSEFSFITRVGVYEVTDHRRQAEAKPDSAKFA